MKKIKRATPVSKLEGPGTHVNRNGKLVADAKTKSKSVFVKYQSMK